MGTQKMAPWHQVTAPKPTHDDNRPGDVVEIVDTGS